VKSLLSRICTWQHLLWVSDPLHPLPGSHPPPPECINLGEMNVPDPQNENQEFSIRILLEARKGEKMFSILVKYLDKNGIKSSTF